MLVQMVEDNPMHLIPMNNPLSERSSISFDYSQIPPNQKYGALQFSWSVYSEQSA